MSRIFLDRIENGPFFVNTYLLGCPETGEAILIDPGHETDRIAERMKASGHRYTAIVNTHGHIDHVAGVKHFQTSMGLPFRMHEADSFLLDSLPQQCAAFGLPLIETPEMGEPLVEGDTVTVGKVTFGLRHAPGHSPGSLVFDLGDMMIVGDVVFEGSIGRTDLPGGDTNTLLASIRDTVLTKADDVTLYPGHGPETTVGKERLTNPFLVSGQT